jgi:hypothetical protein
VATALGIGIIVVAGAQTVSIRPAAAAPSLDGTVRAVLDEIDAHGFNPAVNGLYINWSVDNPAQVNLPSGSTALHDGLTDLRDLVNMLWYEQRHPGDQSQAAATARMRPVVAGEFGRYGSDKGWVYWQLLQLTALTGDASWTADARAFATHLAAGIDPATGVAHGPLSASTAEAAASCPDGYRVDHALESGLALADAGQRFGVPAWSAAGPREVAAVTSQAFDTAHHLFDRIVCQGTVWDAHVKAGEQADDITSLLDAGASTGTGAWTSLGGQMLDALASSPLHDAAAGGFFSSWDMAGGTVGTAYKETRQLALLTAAHRADSLGGGRWAGLEREMTGVALSMAVAVPLQGYPYREPPGFGFFGRERWITTEAAGIALEAMQGVLAPVAPPAPVRRAAPPPPVAAPRPPVAPPAAPAAAPPLTPPTVDAAPSPAPASPTDASTPQASGLPGTGPRVRMPVQATAASGPVPWLPAVLVIALGSALAGAVALRRRRRPR